MWELFWNLSGVFWNLSGESEENYDYLTVFTLVYMTGICHL